MPLVYLDTILDTPIIPQRPQYPKQKGFFSLSNFPWHPSWGLNCPMVLRKIEQIFFFSSTLTSLNIFYYHVHHLLCLSTPCVNWNFFFFSIYDGASNIYVVQYEHFHHSMLPFSSILPSLTISHHYWNYNKIRPCTPNAFTRFWVNSFVPVNKT